MAKLKPKEKAYYGHFSSAVRAAHAAAVAVAGLADSRADRGAVAEQLAALVEVADTEYRSVLVALRKSFVTPFDRVEIQTLSRALDRAVRHLEATGALVNLLDPATLPDEFGAVSTLLQQAAGETEEAVDKLKKLKGLKHHHERIAGMAAEAEFHRRLLLVRLTSGEMDPLDAVELHAISDELARAVDAFVEIAEAVETVVITEG